MAEETDACLSGDSCVDAENKLDEALLSPPRCGDRECGKYVETEVGVVGFGARDDACGEFVPLRSVPLSESVRAVSGAGAETEAALVPVGVPLLIPVVLPAPPPTDVAMAAAE